MFAFLKKNRTYDNPEFLDQVESLKARGNDPIAKIALNNLKKTEVMINHASKGQEIIITDMYTANRIPLDMLEKGDDFFGISAITNAVDWSHNEDLIKYKEVILKQSKAGINMERTFVLQNIRELDSLRAIMDEQSAAGTKVSYVLEDDLKSLSYFPDFTIIPKFNLVIYVPNLDNLTTCVATCDQTLVTELMKDYEIVQRYSTQWNYTE